MTEAEASSVRVCATDDLKLGAGCQLFAQDIGTLYPQIICVVPCACLSFYCSIQCNLATFILPGYSGKGPQCCKCGVSCVYQLRNKTGLPWRNLGLFWSQDVHLNWLPSAAIKQLLEHSYKLRLGSHPFTVNSLLVFRLFSSTPSRWWCVLLWSMCRDTVWLLMPVKTRISVPVRKTCALYCARQWGRQSHTTCRVLFHSLLSARQLLQL